MMLAPPARIIFVGNDKALAESTRSSIGRLSAASFEHLDCTVLDAVNLQRLDEAGVLIVDLDANNRDELVALQKLMVRFPGTIPVIILTPSFDDAVGRWFLQIRVSDFLKKPVSGEEVALVTTVLLGQASGSSSTVAITSSFIAAAGGVGNTTLAVETAIQHCKAEQVKGRKTCLVDLDFQNDSCASHLDVEPRLDLIELGSQGERLDSQLLEVMASRHASGLVLFGAICTRGNPETMSGDAVLRLLDVISSSYDRVVIDLPRTWHPWTEDVLHGSDQIFVVTDMTVPGLRSAKRVLQRIIDKAKPNVPPKVIVNRAEKQSFFGNGIRKADVERVLEDSFAGLVSNNYALVREAIDRGVPLEVVKPGNSVTADLKKILFA